MKNYIPKVNYLSKSQKLFNKSDIIIHEINNEQSFFNNFYFFKKDKYIGQNNKIKNYTCILDVCIFMKIIYHLTSSNHIVIIKSNKLNYTTSCKTRLNKREF